MSNIVWLNVGGEKFCTSVETLTWHPDTFFTGLLRPDGVGIGYDAEKCIFIDRDPELFKPILHYLRTRRISLPAQITSRSLYDEAEFYNIRQLSSRLKLTARLDEESCGGIHFYEKLTTPESAPISIITGNGPLLACIQLDAILLFQFDEHHGWRFEARHHLDAGSRIDHLTVKYMSPKRDQPNSPMAQIAVSSGPVVHFFKLKKTSDQKCRFDELDGHDFARLTPSVNGIEHLKFVGSQLLAVSDRQSAQMAVWNAARQGRWQQHKVPEQMLCLECVSTFVYLGTETGRIHYTDLQKFPLRTKDNSLLVTELHCDYLTEPITALAVSFERTTQKEKCPDPFDSLELCYGTAAGTVRIMVQSPEHHTHGLRSLQLLQTYKVHSSPIVSVELSEKFLITCCQRRHVRTWSMTRFRGVLSTQPGSVPYADFELTQEPLPNQRKEQLGPYGDGTEIPIFVQQPFENSDTLFIRTGDTGTRIGTFTSVTGASLSTYASHDFEGSPRMGLKPRRLILTGHRDGSVQVWDVARALEDYRRDGCTKNEPITPRELLDICQRVNQC